MPSVFRVFITRGVLNGKLNKPFTLLQAGKFTKKQASVVFIVNKDNLTRQRLCISEN